MLIDKIMSCRYLDLCGCRVQARWQEILLILIVDVPSIIGAAGELVEARGLFRLVIVELGVCVFGKTATERIKRSKTEKESKRQNNWRI